HALYGFVTLFAIFFFFSSRRRHTRSKRDWSSDVCSSDLVRVPCSTPRLPPAKRAAWRPGKSPEPPASTPTRRTPGSSRKAWNRRSEERRVGKECRSRWAADQEKKK